MLALRIGLVDNPDGRRKLHTREIAVSGGIPVYLTALFGVVVALLVPNRWQNVLLADWMFVSGLLASTTLIVLIGLIDDAKGMRGRHKLLGQIVAAGIVVACGLQVDHIAMFGHRVSLGLMAIPFTMFWLLGAINAFNLIDGVDGLASSIGLIISLGLAGMAAMYGHGAYAIFAVALAGSLAGFLVYNFPPARIFLGDSGSMLIGLVLGTLAIRCSLKGPATAALVVPTAIWTIPIFDVAMAVLRRKLTGKSLYETDRGHLHHRLLDRGLNGKSLLLGVGVLCLIAGLGSMASMALENEYLALGSAMLVIVILVLTRSFGHTELGMLARRVKRVAVSFVPNQKLRDRGSVPLQAHLQGDREWDQLWDLLIDFAERFEVHSIELNVSMPAIGEEYHAKWSPGQVGSSAEVSVFRTDLPLVFEDTVAGRLRVSGYPANTASVCSWVEELMIGLKPFESQMLKLIKAAEANEMSPKPALRVG
jgi:UDP-GlcNAc:undecaprenyl-phosphate GlcNAc-1-phosphate transferase